MNRIIVPTDFSETAWNATCHALEYSKLFNAEVLFLHVFEYSYNDLEANPTRVSATISSEKKKMTQLALRVKSTLPNDDINIQTRCVEGSLINRLNEVITDEGNELVIMGTTGRSGFFGRIFGSNTSRIMNEIKCPLMIVPSEYKFDIDRAISIGITYDSILRLKDISLINNLIQIGFKPKPNLVHIISDYNDPEKELPLNQFINFNTSLKEIIGENIPDLLEKYALANNSGLLILIKKDKNFYNKIIQRSVSDRLAINAKTPLLLLPNPT